MINLIGLDADNSGTISFDEFCILMAYNSENHDPQQIVDNIFMLFQDEKKKEDNISIPDFRRMMETLNAGLTPEDIEEFVREMDANGDGAVDRHELANMLKKHLH